MRVWLNIKRVIELCSIRTAVKHPEIPERCLVLSDSDRQGNRAFHGHEREQEADPFGAAHHAKHRSVRAHVLYHGRVEQDRTVDDIESRATLGLVVDHRFVEPIELVLCRDR